MAKAVAMGKPPADVGEHGEVRMNRGQRNWCARRPLFGRWRGVRRGDISVANSPFDAMRHSSTTLPFAHPVRALSHSGAIEWEELPSLADSLNERLVVLGTRHRDAMAAAKARAAAFERAASAGHAWDSTRPAEFEPDRPSPPFREPIDGMAMREVIEPDVFRHFFGVPRDVEARQR